MNAEQVATAKSLGVLVQGVAAVAHVEGLELDPPLSDWKHGMLWYAKSLNPLAHRLYRARQINQAIKKLKLGIAMMERR